VKAILRSLIVWLALLAVPFQGFASAAMQPCAPAPAPAHHAAATAHHDHGMQHQHAGHCDDSRQASHQTKCSHCGACCVGVAIMPAALAAIAPPSRVTTAIPFDAGPVPSVHLDHPERPPRFPRA
jgi:hypothetical protein